MHTEEQLRSARAALIAAHGSRSQAEFILAQNGWPRDTSQQSALDAAIREYVEPVEPVVVAEETKLANPRTMTDLVF